MTTSKQPAKPVRKSARSTSAISPSMRETAASFSPDSDFPLLPQKASTPDSQAGGAVPLIGEYIGKEDWLDGRDRQAYGEAGADPVDEDVLKRVEHLNRNVGWVLLSAGTLGLMIPGVLGTPFLLMGTLALWPGNRKILNRWRQDHSSKVFHVAMKQVNRFLDDLEKRYPRTDKR